MIYQDRKPIFILVPHWEQVHTARIKANNSYLPNGIGMHTSCRQTQKCYQIRRKQWLRQSRIHNLIETTDITITNKMSQTLLHANMVMLRLILKRKSVWCNSQPEKCYRSPGMRSFGKARCYLSQKKRVYLYELGEDALSDTTIGELKITLTNLNT